MRPCLKTNCTVWGPELRSPAPTLKSQAWLQFRSRTWRQADPRAHRPASQASFLVRDRFSKTKVESGSRRQPGLLVFTSDPHTCISSSHIQIPKTREGREQERDEGKKQSILGAGRIKPAHKKNASILLLPSHTNLGSKPCLLLKWRMRVTNGTRCNDSSVAKSTAVPSCHLSPPQNQNRSLERDSKAERPGVQRCQKETVYPVVLDTSCTLFHA